MPWVGFEPTISPGERPNTYALDPAANGTDPQAKLKRTNSLCNDPFHKKKTAWFQFNKSGGYRVN
jgi:hypothetical protein